MVRIAGQGHRRPALWLTDSVVGLVVLLSGAHRSVEEATVVVVEVVVEVVEVVVVASCD